MKDGPPSPPCFATTGKQGEAPESDDIMHTFTAHRLRFLAEAQSTIELNEHQGSAIRGALFHALRNRFCANQAAGECAACAPRAAYRNRCW